MYLPYIHYGMILHRNINTIDGDIWELPRRLVTSIIKTITEKIEQKLRNLLKQLTLWLYLMYPQIMVHKNYLYVKISKIKKQPDQQICYDTCIIGILEGKGN